jgi:hypothetical protein
LGSSLVSIDSASMLAALAYAHVNLSLPCSDAYEVTFTNREADWFSLDALRRDWRVAHSAPPICSISTYIAARIIVAPNMSRV